MNCFYLSMQRMDALFAILFFCDDIQCCSTSRFLIDHRLLYDDSRKCCAKTQKNTCQNDHHDPFLLSYAYVPFLRISSPAFELI